MQCKFFDSVPILCLTYEVEKKTAKLSKKSRKNVVFIVLWCILTSALILLPVSAHINLRWLWSFCWYWWICQPSLFKFSFYTDWKFTFSVLIRFQVFNATSSVIKFVRIFHSFLTPQSNGKQLNVLTNRTTIALGMCSVLIPRDTIGSWLIGRFKIWTPTWPHMGWIKRYNKHK